MPRQFTPAETEIFPVVWPDGTEGKLDPLAVRRRLGLATHGLIDQLLDQACAGYQPGNHESVYRFAQAQEQLIKACPYAFDCEGATEQWYWDTLMAFDAWLQKKRASGPTTCTSPPPADSGPAASSATSSGS